MRALIDKLYSNRCLDRREYAMLLGELSESDEQYLYSKAREAAFFYYGNNVYIRGLIEFTNFCKNNCYYCGIRCGNKNINRYRLSREDILKCCDKGYRLGFRTFVLQGGEDEFYSDEYIISIVSSIKNKYSDCAVTLSIGERNRESYKSFYAAGADRYLLRHETADNEHYKRLHPDNMSPDNRKRCLYDLKEIGYQTGCGIMVGSPYQTIDNLVDDIIFMKDLSPHMIGIGPFISHKDTPFKSMHNGALRDTLRLLAVLRLSFPNVLIPATTALGTIADNGRELGILAGGNVLMPNLSPENVRDNYKLYDNKMCSGEEAAEGLTRLTKRIEAIGYKIITDRGDCKSVR